jgi:hypothetical protein
MKEVSTYAPYLQELRGKSIKTIILRFYDGQRKNSFKSDRNQLGKTDHFVEKQG